MSSNTVGAVLKSLSTGKATAVETVTKYLKYIERYNKTINAVVTINEHLLEEARQLDQLFLQNGVTGPLHGLPVIIKDCFATKGIRTTCGSPSLKDHIPTYDAEVVHLLKLAGALIVGKSNTPEMCMDVQTFNPVFGVTNNPFDTSKTAGGSSGGSAAAVACNMAPVAIGSDLTGSLRIPASFCGIVSLKPTTGRLMIQEVVVGPMANDVKSLEIIMHVLSRRNFCNRTHIGLYDFEFPSRPFQIMEKPQTLRIALTPHIEGIPTDWRIVRSIAKFAQRLSRVGVTCHIEETLPHGFPSMKDILLIVEAHKVLAGEFEYARNLKTPSEKHPEDHSPTSAQIGAAKIIRSRTRHAIESFLETHDAWILPVSCVLPFAHDPAHGPIACELDAEDARDAGAAGSAARRDASAGASSQKSAGANAGAGAGNATARYKKIEIPYWRALTPYVTPFSVSGNPVLTMPICGVCEECDHWLPDTASVCRKCGFGFGVQIVGRRWEDEKLTAVGRVLEKVTRLKSRDRSLNIGKRAKM